MTDFLPNRPPKRYTAKQFTDWRARWTGIDPDEALRSRPFGTTEDGLFDFRGLTITDPNARRKRSLHRALFKSCDFTAGSLAETISEHGSFDTCVFDYTDLNNFSDKGNIFQNCRFYRGEWQTGGIGTDWNTSTRGEYQSRYTNCHFENIKLTKTSIGDPQFINCSFVFKKLSGIDFRCSGFIACRFIGAFQDLTFRGAYDPEDRTRKGDPEFAGFTDVSFEQAALQWIDLRGGFRFRSVKMPTDGSAFTADLPRLCRDRTTVLDRMTEQRPRELAARYLDINCRFAPEQQIDIISRFDLTDCAEKGEEAIADTLYNMLKNDYTKPT
ncbi:MAG: hypothetical protein PHT60_02790 [Acidiphilium sp.]|nr:hypothetical protein [Acidiphilium sp.]MDD4934682.1 hypothetical protein [Acidiphilium sp.]